MQDKYKIAVPIPRLTELTYSIPSEFLDESPVGKRALVKVGNRYTTGVVTEPTTGEEVREIKSIEELLDEIPVFTGEMIELCRRISDYYICSLGEVFAAAVPKGVSPKSVIKIKILQVLSDWEIAKISGRSKLKSKILQILSEGSGELTMKYLRRRAESNFVDYALEGLEQAGIVSRERILDRGASAKKMKAVRLPDNLIENEEAFRAALDGLDKKAYKQSLLLSSVWLRQKKTGEPQIAAKLIEEAKTSHSTISGLAKKGLLEETTVEVDRSLVEVGEELVARDEKALMPTEEQAAAIEDLIRKIEADIFSATLIYGVTGSGKTLVYMKAIEKAIERGESALVLVPEISLTPQLIQRFRAYFGDKAVALHSRLSDGEKFDAWREIRRGKYSIVIGPRSAVFAPLQKLGIIIVDEEHDDSYKQNSPVPYYNGRDVAVLRASIEGVPAVLGSGTPSLESMHNALNGKYDLIKIENRVDGAKPPIIEAIDMIDANKSGKTVGSYSEDLLLAIAENVAKKLGTILLLNRRGYSPFLACPECGHVPECRNCDVTMTYHKRGDALRCHYCGYSIRAFRRCPECGAPELIDVGAGSQKIEEEFEQIAKERNIDVKVERVDLDSTRGKGSFEAILGRFSSGETNVLIGTQMVSKGLDFERASLAAAVNADLRLFAPDFRSAERTFRLLTQLAGRTGRSGKYPGKLFVQTSKPSHPAIQAVLRGSYEEFYENETRYRRQLNYPPYSRFISIEFYGKNPDKVNEKAKLFYELIPNRGNFMIVYEPTSPHIVRLKTNYRRIIVVKSLKSKDPSGKKTATLLRFAYEEYLKTAGSYSVGVRIDVDASGM